MSIKKVRRSPLLTVEYSDTRPTALFESIRQVDALGRAKKRSLGVAVSFALHGLVVGGVFGASVWASSQADEKPVKVSFFAPPPPPPPPPAGGGQKAKKTPKKVEIKPKKVELVQPKEIPDQKKEEPKKTEDPPEEGGQEGGVKGGVAGGTVGGTVGGVIGGVLGGELGGKLSYEKVAKPPSRIAGEEQPPIPGSMLPALRGSKGTIRIKFLINAQGNVDRVEILISQIPLLDEIMKKHVMSWKFAPTTINGRAVAIEFAQNFRMAF